LPADPRGAVWYLVVLFIVASAIVVRFLVREPASPKLFVAVGAWGTIWAISSYFVSRSHPVNLLTLIPLLVFSIAILLHLLRSSSSDPWSDLLTFVTAPLLAMPILITMAHSGFPNLLFHEQWSLRHFTMQVPAMNPSLAELAKSAGMRPSDPVFFVSEGKFLLPRWPDLDANGDAILSPIAFAPKPYEVISTLPAARRDLYITRFLGQFKSPGWLVEKKSAIDPGYESVLRLIEKSHSRVRTFENEDWVIYRYAPLAPR